MQFIRKLIKDKKGATAIEYGLIAALIAVAAITAMQGIGTSLNATFTNVSNGDGRLSLSRFETLRRAAEAIPPPFSYLRSGDG